MSWNNSFPSRYSVRSGETVRVDLNVGWTGVGSPDDYDWDISINESYMSAYVDFLTYIDITGTSETNGKYILVELIGTNLNDGTLTSGRFSIRVNPTVLSDHILDYSKAIPTLINIHQGCQFDLNWSSYYPSGLKPLTTVNSSRIFDLHTDTSDIDDVISYYVTGAVDDNQFITAQVVGFRDKRIEFPIIASTHQNLSKGLSVCPFRNMKIQMSDYFTSTPVVSYAGDPNIVSVSIENGWLIVEPGKYSGETFIVLNTNVLHFFQVPIINYPFSGEKPDPSRSSVKVEQPESGMTPSTPTIPESTNLEPPQFKTDPPVTSIPNSTILYKDSDYEVIQQFDGFVKNIERSGDTFRLTLGNLLDKLNIPNEVLKGTIGDSTVFDMPRYFDLSKLDWPYTD